MTTDTDPPPQADDNPYESPDMPSVSLGPHFELHPRVFPAGALIVLALVALTFLFPQEQVLSWFEEAKGRIGTNFGWLYVISLTGMLIFCAWLALGRFGKLRLGKDDEQPEFSTLSWFAMLFSAGMGIGLVFWSVAEPIYHYTGTPPGSAEGLDPSRISMAVTIFHWGLHPWALYAVVGLSLAYFGFRRGMPLSFRSMLHPLLGDRVWGVTGDIIDTLAIIATLTGVATSLGLGAQQVNAGLAFLLGAQQSVEIQMLIIASITAVATVSVVLGLGTGIRRLSEANLVLAGVLLVMVILGGGVVAFLASSVENTGAYLQLLPFNSFRTGSFTGEGNDWVNAWTVFYWAWWVSWSPFVGMFIARISRGRTIREFIAGVVLVPTIVGIFWLTAFGSAALRQHTDHLEQLEQSAQTEEAAYVPAEELPVYPVAIKDADDNLLRGDDDHFQTQDRPLTAVQYLSSPIVSDDHSATIATVPTVLFALLDGLFESPALVTFAAGVATLCIILFFVTSSDSASMVIDIIASGGNPDPPVGTRLFWAITEGVVAAALLFVGGLKALQAASIVAALPFVIILLLMCISLTKALYAEERPSPAQP